MHNGQSSLADKHEHSEEHTYGRLIHSNNNYCTYCYYVGDIL